MLGIVGILIALVFLVGMAYRGHAVIYIAPISALIALVFSGAPLLAGYTQIFMPALGTFVVSFFPLFLTGAIFGKLMSDSGYASLFAQGMAKLFGEKRAILATSLTTAVLTYGGVSLFVVAFSVYPIARELFIKANIPKRLIPGAMAIGASTFTMTALPGSPQIQNVIPSKYFDTSLYSAPGYGFLASAIMLLGGLSWITYRARTLNAGGEGFLKEGDSESAADDTQPGSSAPEKELTFWRFMLAFTPIAIVILGNLAMSNLILPSLDFSYLGDEKYGSTTLNSVIAIWSVLVSIVLAIGFILISQPRRMRTNLSAFNSGTREALLPAFSTASEAGFGAVISSLAAFVMVSQAIGGISDNPLITSAITTTVLAGLTGSAAGGMTVALETLSEQLKTAAADQGISLEVVHRVVSIASGGLDTMPHAGGVIAMLMVCGLTHRQAYKDIGMVTIAAPLVACAVVVTVASVMA